MRLAYLLLGLLLFLLGLPFWMSGPRPERDGELVREETAAQEEPRLRDPRDLPAEETAEGEASANRTAPSNQRRAAATVQVQAPAEAQPDRPTLRTLLIVRASETLRRDAPGLGGLLVELGLGRSARQGSRVSARVGSRSPLRRVRLDGAGVWAGAPELAPLAEEDVLWARVVEPGYRRTLSAVRLEELRPGYELRVVGVRGASVTGRVFDADAAPIVGARVRALLPGDDGEWKNRGNATTDEQGHFEIHLAQAGTYAFQCWVHNAGSAFAADFVVQEDGSHGPVELVLRGSAYLAGRVRSPGGAPIPHLRLQARPAQVQGRIVDRQRMQGARAQGTWDGECTTDAQGAFRFEGLAPGAYAIHVWSPEHNVYRDALTTAAVSTNRDDLELVHDRLALLVRVRAPDGSPVDVSQARWYGPRLDEQPKLLVAPSDAQGRLPRGSRDPSLAPQSVGPGELLYELESDETYSVVLASAAAPLQVRQLHSNDVEGVRLEEFVFAGAAESTRLRLRITDPEGVDFANFVRVRIHELESRTPVYVSSRSSIGPNIDCALPPGRFRIEVDCARYGQHGNLAAEPHAPYESQFELVAGEQRHLEARLRRAGRLELLVRATALEPQVPFQSDATARLEPLDGGRPRALEFDLAGIPELGIPVFHGAITSRSLPFNVAVEAERVVPAGGYRLVVSLPEGSTLEREIEIVAGARLRVELGP